MDNIKDDLKDDLKENKAKTNKASTKTKKSVVKDVSASQAHANSVDINKSPTNRENNGQRDSKGRFVKGCSGNPNGRPKLPEELKRYGMKSFERLKAIADDPNCPYRVKADIEKWFAEMTYGKALQQMDMEAKVENTAPVSVTFEGKLDEWSK